MFETNSMRTPVVNVLKPAPRPPTIECSDSESSETECESERGVQNSLFSLSLSDNNDMSEEEKSMWRQIKGKTKLTTFAEQYPHYEFEKLPLWPLGGKQRLPLSTKLKRIVTLGQKGQAKPSRFAGPPPKWSTSADYTKHRLHANLHYCKPVGIPIPTDRFIKYSANDMHLSVEYSHFSRKRCQTNTHNCTLKVFDKACYHSSDEQDCRDWNRHRIDQKVEIDVLRKLARNHPELVECGIAPQLQSFGRIKNTDRYIGLLHRVSGPFIITRGDWAKLPKPHHYNYRHLLTAFISLDALHQRGYTLNSGSLDHTNIPSMVLHQFDRNGPSCQVGFADFNKAMFHPHLPGTRLTMALKKHRFEQCIANDLEQLCRYFAPVVETFWPARSAETTNTESFRLMLIEAGIIKLPESPPPPPPKTI